MNRRWAKVALVLFVVSTPLSLIWPTPAIIAWLAALPGVLIAAVFLNRRGRGTLESPTGVFFVLVAVLASSLNVMGQVGLLAVSLGRQ